MGRPLQDLERDWAMTAAGRAAQPELARWARREPVLARFSSLLEVVDVAQSRRCQETSNAALAALLRLAGGEPLARRALLQAVLPALAAQAAEHTRDALDREERFQQAVALALERIDQLAGTTHPWPAWAITSHIRERLRTSRGADARRRFVPLEEAHHLPAGEARSASERVTSLLVDAVRRGVLRKDEASLVYATRVAGYSPAEVAGAAGLDPATLRTRRFRAERRLAEATVGRC